MASVVASPSASSATKSVSGAAPGWYFVGASPVEMKVEELGLAPTEAASSLVDTRFLPPSREQLLSLRAVPMAFSSGARATKKKGKSKGKGAGKSSNVVFNPQAGRPYPKLSTNDTQITACLEITSSAFTSSLTVPTYYGRSFQLSDFGNVAEYTALFDQYRFDSIEAWIEPSIVESSTLSSPLYYSAVDVDDGNTPAVSTTVAAKQGVLSSSVGTGHYHKWQPHMAIAAFSGAFTSYSNEVAGWIDSASPSVQHYGLKCAIPGVDSVVRIFYLTIRAKVSFRAPGI